MPAAHAKDCQAAEAYPCYHSLIRGRSRSLRWRECRSARKTCFAALSWWARRCLRLGHDCLRRWIDRSFCSKFSAASKTTLHFDPAMEGKSAEYVQLPGASTGAGSLHSLFRPFHPSQPASRPYPFETFFLPAPIGLACALSCSLCCLSVCHCMSPQEAIPTVSSHPGRGQATRLMVEVRSSGSCPFVLDCFAIVPAVPCVHACIWNKPHDTPQAIKLAP